MSVLGSPSPHEYFTNLRQLVNITGIGERLQLIHPLDRRRLKTRLRRIVIGNDRVDLHVHDTQSSVNPLGNLNAFAGHIRSSKK